MAENPNLKPGKASNPFTGARVPGADLRPQIDTRDDDFPGDFARVKVSIIRPAFENIGTLLKERGHDIHISEDEHGKISIHIVPPGVTKSIQAYDWFPTLSFFGAPYTKTIGMQGRNARRNAESSTGARGDYKPAQLSRDIVEKELMKFVGEIANW